MVNNLSATAISKKTFPTIPKPVALSEAGPVSISSTFCGGNIVHVGTESVDDGGSYKVRQRVVSFELLEKADNE
jgi:hypothetical protein